MYGIPIGCRILGVEQRIQPVANAFYRLPDDKTIRNQAVFVFAIQTFCDDQLSKTPSDLTPITLAGAKGLTITLQDDANADRIADAPYFDFIASENTGYPREMRPFRLSLTNSGVRVQDVTNIVADNGVYICIWYMYESDMIKYGIPIPSRAKQLNK